MTSLTALAATALAGRVSPESTLELLPESARATAVVTGSPLRPEILTGQADKAVQALGAHGFDPRRPTGYLTGRAQGSQQINTLVRDIRPWLPHRANVVHRTSAGNEQAHNARRLQESGAAIALLGEATPDTLRDAVAPLLAEPDRRTAMAQRARAAGRPDGAERVVDVVPAAATGRGTTRGAARHRAQ